LSKDAITDGFPADVESSDGGLYYMPDGRSAERSAWCDPLSPRPEIATGYCAAFRFGTSNPFELITII